jgi:hypothetical protein
MFLHEDEIRHMGYYVDINHDITLMQQLQQQQLQSQPLQERRTTVQQQETFEPLKIRCVDHGPCHLKYTREFKRKQHKNKEIYWIFIISLVKKKLLPI